MSTSTDRKHFFLAVNTGYVSGKEPDSRCCDFYGRRSGNGLYCAIVGNVVIPGGFGTNDRTPEISSSNAWKQLAHAISAGGARPGIQLATTWLGYTGQRNFVSKTIEAELEHYRRIAAGLNRDDIRNLFETINIGTQLALSAGFSHVQLHGAHGYLFSLLLDPRIYADAADFVGLLTIWAEKWRGRGVETSLRFSLRTGYTDFDEKGRSEFLDSVVRIPVDYFDVSSGFYEIDKRLIYPSRREVVSLRRMETLGLASRNPGRQFILSGKAGDAFARDFPKNVHIGLCRDIIANPNFLATGAFGCANSMKCHWYSRGAHSLECGRWKWRNNLVSGAIGDDDLLS